MQFTITILLPEGQTEEDVQALLAQLTSVPEGTQVSVFGTEAQAFVAGSDGSLAPPQLPKT